MSRKKTSNDILTREKQVKVGTRILRGAEPVAWVGPEKKKDTFSLQDMAVALYGPGTQCYVVTPDSCEKAV